MEAASSPSQFGLGRLWPRSLVGRMALAISLALTAGQIMNVFLLLNEQQWGQLARRTGLAEAFCGEAFAELFSAPSEQAAAQIGGMSNNPLMSLEMVGSSLRDVRDLIRDVPLEERLRGALERRGFAIAAIEAGARPVLHRWMVRDPRGAPQTQQMAGERFPPHAVPMETFIAARQLPGGDWLQCRVVNPPEDPSINMRLLLGTLTLYVIVLGSLLLLTRWLVAPMSRLAAAAQQMGSGRRVSPLSLDGPREVSAVAEAFNEMSARITRLLIDKDAMLGAIGHDLRTPLTSLRIRAENLEQSSGRDRMIESIEHLARMLDGILEFSKIGVNKEAPVPTDVTALISTIVEEFEDLGADVRQLSTGCHQATLRPHLFMRLLRNLIENAVKYGARARVSAESISGALLIHVDDDGPGLSEEVVDRLMRPFERLDMSRNSVTGGAGLGLSIAKTIADVHGASLHFENRRAGGLRVTICVEFQE